MPIYRQPLFTLKLMFLMILLNCSIVRADVEHWKQLKAAVDNKCFSGIDLDLKFEAGIKAQDEEDSDHETFSKIVLAIPLLSKTERIKRREAKREYIDRGITVIQEIEETEARMDTKCEYIRVLEKIGQEQGFESMKEIMTIQEEIDTLDAQHRAAERKLEGYLKCSEKLE